MSEFSFLLDAPAAPTTRMQIAQIGEFKDPRYGEFSITPEEVEDWAKNLAALPGGQALIDEDHLSDKPSPHRRTEAMGWITGGVGLEGDRVMANVAWTPKGTDAIKEGRFLFFSPAFGMHMNEKGDKFPNTLTGGALTNKPFLTGMPVITLASAPRLLEAVRQTEEEGGESVFTLDQAYEQGMTVLDISQDMREKHAVVVKEIDGKKTHMFPIPPGDKVHARAALSLLPAAIKAGHINSSEAAEVRARANSVLGKKLESDSRPQMKLTADILKTLGVTDEDTQKRILEMAEAEDADFTKIHQEITQAVAETGGSEPDLGGAKTLEEWAANQGKVVLAADKFSEILARGNAAGDENEAKLPEVTPELLTTLGIEGEEDQKKVLDIASAEDADFPKLLGAIVGVKSGGEPTIKTLEQQATEQGKVILDAPQLAQLTADAKAGKEAADDLKKMTFDTAFSRNESKGKVVPAQREQFETFFELDQAGTIKMMDDAPQILNVKPQGKNEKPADENMPEGVHQEGFELDAQVQAYMQEHEGTDYIKALEAVTGMKVGQ